MVCIFTACEHSTKFTENGIKYWEWQGELIVEGFENEADAVKDLVIKGTVEFSPKYYTWAVQHNAFENTEIESLTIEYYKAENNPYYSEGLGALTFEEIRDCAFKNCKKLKTVSLPYGMTTIGWQAFYGCESLETVTFPYCLESIGDEAFAECTLLREIHIDKNLQRLGAKAFINCAEDVTLYLNCLPPETNGVVFADTAKVRLIVPREYLNAYKDNKFWAQYKIEAAN